MTRKLQIEIEDEIFRHLNDFCKGDENVMQDFIAHTLKEKFNKIKSNVSSEEKDSLESYLKKGQSGSRNYGVKGQGW